jgi:hypothetical protein
MIFLVNRLGTPRAVLAAATIIAATTFCCNYPGLFVPRAIGGAGNFPGNTAHHVNGFI